MEITDLSLFALPIALLVGWLLDLLMGDPVWLPHPVVGFGKMISFSEKKLNKGGARKMKGALTACFLIIFIFVVTWVIRKALFLLPSPLGGETGLRFLFDVIAIFYCLAGTTLIREVKQVFKAVDRSLEEGRKQVARIVGRDTSELSAQEIRTAALETLAENLSDGVVAPLFWLAVGGVPAMMAYKMVNTLDSMIGYQTERYKDFGCWAAHIDDVANYIPARLTALLMMGSAFVTPSANHRSLFSFIRRYGRNHASPNSGYPEAALAGILDCQFGGPHYYFGEIFYKPYIGENPRPLTTADMEKAVCVNRISEILAIVIIIVVYCL